MKTRYALYLLLALLTFSITAQNIPISSLLQSQSIISFTQDPSPNTSFETTQLPMPSQQPQQQSQKVSHSQGIPGVGLGVLFIFGSLLYGGCLKLLSQIIYIHYYPILIISGLILGMTYQSWGMVGEATILISKAQPRGILAIFLPCLILQSAFKTQWHVFKKLVWQSLIMGVLSSFVGACLLMVAVKIFLDPYDNYKWYQALMLGSILTCTDILSFVNRFRRAGTPQKLTSLLQGQSLFNYCTCMMIFEFIQYYIDTQQEQYHWTYFTMFLQYVFGGILFGLISGVVAVYCIKRMIYDGVLVVTLIVIFCYSIYLTAQYSSYRVSSLISITVFSLYMNAFGKTWLFGETGEFMKSFWSYLTFVSQTSICMIAGVLVGYNLLAISQTHIFDLKEQLLNIVLIYLFVIFSRFISITAFLKYLRKFGQDLNLKEIAVLTVAGLKGAIGIALAMHVFGNRRDQQYSRTLTMIHVTANALLTLTVNTIVIGPIVKIMGVSTLRGVDYKLFLQYLASFESSILDRRQQIKNQLAERHQRQKLQNLQNQQIEWTQVDTQIGLQQLRKMRQQKKKLEKNQKITAQTSFKRNKLFTLLEQIRTTKNIQVGTKQMELRSKFQLQVQYRKRFLKDLIAKYWQFHDKNFTSPAALMLLIQSANYDLDTDNEQIQSWNWIKSEVTFNIKLYSQLMKLTIVNKFAKSYLFEYVSFCYDVVSSYIKANQQVREQFQYFFQNNEEIKQQELGPVLANILRQSQQNQSSAQFFLKNYLEPSFPQIQKQVKTRKVSFFILHSFKDVIDNSNENGQLQPNEYDMLSSITDQRSLELNLASPKWQQTNLFLVLKQNTIFRVIPDNILQILIEESGQEMTFDANQLIINNGQIGKYMYFVKRGGVIVEFVNKNMVYKEPMLVGEVFGFESMLTNVFHTQVTANSMVEVVRVKSYLVTRVFDCFPMLQEAFWKKHAFQCYKMFSNEDQVSEKISHLKKQIFEELLGNLQLRMVEPHDNYSVTADHIYIRGNAEIIQHNLDGSSNQISPANLIKHSSDLSEFVTNIKRKISHQEEISIKNNLPPEDPNEIHDYSIIPLNPFSFIPRYNHSIIKVREVSYFLVGNIDFEIFERSSNIKMSVNRSVLNRSKISKKY